MAYADSTHPPDEVNAEFASRTARSTDQPVSLGPPDGSGWVLASDLLTDDGILRETLERYGAHWRTPRPFLQAALLMFPYIAPVVSAAILGLYSRRRVPDVSAENYAIRFDESGDIVEHTFISRRFAALSTDPEAGHADATTLPDFESLIRWLNAICIHSLSVLPRGRNSARTSCGRPWRVDAPRLLSVYRGTDISPLGKQSLRKRR